MADTELAAVLAEFARTMLTDFGIQAILDRLVERIVDVLDVDGAGVTLIGADLAPRYVAASDARALDWERLQSSLGQGPCLVAAATGAPVLVPHLALDERWPAFRPAAVAAGLSAVFTFPLQDQSGCLGALDVYRSRAGELAPSQVSTAQVLADVVTAYLSNAQARQLALDTADQLRTSAQHDALTGLPNRLVLHERLEQAGRRSLRSRTATGVLFVDLDRFKRVNDVYGHHVGDQLLGALARRLAGCLRPGDTLARVSGDEFVVLCEDLTGPEDLGGLAERLLTACAAPYAVAGTELSLGASVGVARSAPGEAVTYELVVQADAAMYRAKREGGGRYHLHDAGDVQDAQAKTDLETDLRHALANGGLDLAYQPVVRASDGSMTGTEALLRWSHPEHGPVPALTAIGIAEQSGLIHQLGAWVLEHACHQHVLWLAAGAAAAHWDLSVNVSVHQIMAPGFLDVLRTALQRSGIAAEALVLEVTEGIFLADGERTLLVFSQVRELGVRIALDDFGTGYSSLSYLRRYPVDIVKIDRAFVVDLQQDVRAGAVVQAVTHLAHIVGMSVTAEGVETQEQHEQLVRAGCELAQGYLYAPPMSAGQITALLSASDAPIRLPLPDVARLIPVL